MNYLIRIDGTIEKIPAGTPLPRISEMIGADALDTVALPWLGDPLHVMLVDDTGHRSNKPVNPKATRLYLMHCRLGTQWKIRGDVAIVEDHEYGREE